MKLNVEFVEGLEVVSGDARWRELLMPKMENGDYPKGVQLSPLNELSDELSCGLMWIVVVEISSWR